MTIEGAWSFTVTSPVGERTFAAELAVQGAQVVGTLVGEQGRLAVEEGVVDGADVRWLARKAVMGMDMHFRLTVTGDRASGEVKVGVLGKAPVHGTRTNGVAA